MFNLEQAMADWRRQMLAAGIKSPVPLEELESHLREDVERQLRSGSDAQQAFVAAVQRMGQASVVQTEFKKSERNAMSKIMILLGIFGVLVGTACILPALAKYHQQGAMVHDAAVGFLIGIPIFIVGLGTSLCGLKKRKA